MAEERLLNYGSGLVSGGLDQTYAYSQAATLSTDLGQKARVLSGYLFVKRLSDIVLALFGLAALSPLLLTVAAWIKLEDGGSVIHTRICLGKNSRSYKMYKFRSMKMDSNNFEKWLTPQQIQQYRNEYKVDHDPRITACGKLIRKLSIDELPQLVSILKGDMSFVGPRPMTEEESKLYGKYLEIILNAKPGLTGYWQVNGRSDCTYESGERQQLELFYAMRRSLKMDALILLKTVGVVLGRKGAR
jgi:lipopolysaccharide/colanic/teichoic acid biosynthesis glycosyltransferase